MDQYPGTAWAVILKHPGGIKTLPMDHEGGPHIALFAMQDDAESFALHLRAQGGAVEAAARPVIFSVFVFDSVEERDAAYTR